MQKRIVSMLLVLVLLVGLFPQPAKAAETDSNVDSGMTVEGTNGFGNLLSAEIQAEYEAETQDTGNYSVLGLEITGNTAKVEYASMEEAVLVVALYSEDGLQLLCSGKTAVTPDANTATVTIDGSMPEYFQASAYLVDTYDFSPLCAPYDTPMYTREMQELLASTVEDYDADRVLQLDEDKTTNFAVYAEDTIVIQEQAGVNTVASVNDETSTYVIENADDSITSLQAGDIFAYPYGENEILIVKVASISVENGTATITGDEMEMEEAFSHVKIETAGDTADMQVKEDVAVDGVTFEGLVADGVAPMAADGSVGTEKTLKYTLDKKLKGEANYAEASVKLAGTLSLKLKVEFSFYVSASRQFFDLETGVNLKAEVSVSGKVAGKIPLIPFGFSPVAGVYIDFQPNLTLEFSGKLSYSLSAGVAMSMTYESGKGFGFHFKPEADSKLELEGAVFFGIDMNPSLGIVGGAVMEMELSMPVGVKLEAKFAKADSGSGSTHHTCEKCLDMVLKFEAEVGVKLQFLKWDKLTLEKKATFQIKIGDMYYSFDKSRFGWGKCPYLEYQVIIQTRSADNPVANVEVLVDGKVVGNTNSKGLLTVYLPAGNHSFSAAMGGKDCDYQTKITRAGKVILREIGSFGEDGEGGGGFRDQLPGTVTDDGKYLASGTCGENAAWSLNQSGVLTISGNGPMDDWSYNDAPWYDKRDRITTIEIEIGITRIGDWAFSDCDNLTEITVPFGVTDIGNRAFDSSNLTNIFLPSTLSSIGDMAFYWTNLTDVYYQASESQWQGITIGINNDKLINATIHFDQAGDMLGSGGCGGDVRWVVDNEGILTIFGTGEMADYSGGVMPWNDYLTSITKVVISEGVTRISDWAFHSCCNLTSIVIPNGITSIGCAAFAYCSSLTSIVIPEGVTSIGDTTFNNCASLTSIVIPKSITSIGAVAFSGCDSLTSIAIPESVTHIGDQAFSYCQNLKSIDLPETLTYLGAYAFKACFDLSDLVIPQEITSIKDSAFYSCGSLTAIEIPDGVTVIGDQAFYNCTGLATVTIPGSVASIGSRAFSTCRNLTSVVIEEGVATIGSQAFVNCNSLVSMVIPGSVTSIEWGVFNSCNKLKNVYFDGSEDQWNQLGPGISTTSATIHFNSTGPAATVAETLFAETATEDIPKLDAIYGGDYGTEELESYTLKSASFSGLVPNEEYLLLALGSLDTEDVLSANNLLYIDQAVAGEDGKLAFEYVQRTPTTVSYVMACGASNKNVNNGDITFPEMTADGTLQAVEPTVIYEGETLTEGEDYTVLGEVSFTEAGTYTCFIRGIRRYTGLAECSYTVAAPEEAPTTPPTEETKPQQKPTEPEETKPTEPAYENPFADVFEGDYYYTPVLWAVTNSITTGMTATTFEPNGTCTRAQIVTFLWRANGSPTPASGSNPFTDVPAGQWYTDAVLWAVGEGITTGTSATTFSPDASCTRGQVATFLWRSQGRPGVSGDNIFTDIASGAYYYDAVLWAVANEITNGMGDGLFAPDATCTRGQIVTFLYRAMN